MNDQTTPNPIDVISQALQELANSRSSDLVVENLRFLEFKGKKAESNYGKGLIFTGSGSVKQLVLGNIPEDHFFSTENVNLAQDKNYMIDGVKVLSNTELGSSVTKSNLREVGRLKGLVVDGSVNINQYMFYNGAVDRLGLGTEAPNAALSVAEMGIEVMIGTSDDNHGMIGTHASNNFDIVTDNTARISVKANGNIDLGNFNRNPIQVKVNGKLSVGVATPDPAVDLHVAGPVRFNGHVQLYSTLPPTEGNYTLGDIVWNSNPRIGGNVGWVCTRAGNPGTWSPFGDIKQ